MNWAPIARIILRYVAGAGIMGSVSMGDQLAADPDLVFALSSALAIGVETAYAYAKKKGWAT